MFYLNTIEQLFLFVEQLDQLEVCLPYSRLLAGRQILLVFQNLRWNSNKTTLSTGLVSHPILHLWFPAKFLKSPELTHAQDFYPKLSFSKKRQFYPMFLKISQQYHWVSVEKCWLYRRWFSRKTSKILNFPQSLNRQSGLKCQETSLFVEPERLESSLVRILRSIFLRVDHRIRMIGCLVEENLI